MYVVQFGDTLYTVSQKFNVSVNQLLQDNDLPDASRALFPGEILFIPKEQAEAFAEETPADEEAAETAAKRKRPGYSTKRGRSGKRRRRRAKGKG
jgi:LysM repeat protein